MYTISPVYARIVLREMLQRGIPSQALFVGTGLNRGGLQTGGDISKHNFVTFLDNARRLSGDEQLGLLIGRHSNISSLGAMGSAIATAPTIREGLQVMENFVRLHTTYMRAELISSLRGLTMRFHFLEEAGEVERFHAETAVMLVQHYVETVTGAPLDDAKYCFSFPMPDYVLEYSSAMHSPVSFDAALTSVELRPQCLDEPSPYFDSEIWKQAQLQLAKRLRELGDNDEQHYTAHLRALLRASDPPLPDLAAVAARFHMSERTLNRRLQQEGTSFRQVKGGVLGDWARRLLTQTRDSVESIAATLGYQDTANFRRAFRSRENCTPSEFRGRHS